MVKKKRNIGIDLIKIVACFSVITLHSLSPVDPVVYNNIFNISLYYVGTLAIPIFFMASGYFVLNKKNISYFYSFKRIRNILIVVFSWLILGSLAVLIVKNKFNFLNEIEGSVFSGVAHSHFYHFWFFGALIIMLLIAPILVWILQKSFNYFLVLTVLVTIICLIQDVSLHVGYVYLMRNTQQVFRINTWLEYYLLGGLVGNTHFNQIRKFVKNYFIAFSILDIFLYIVLVIYSLWNRQIIGWAYAEANYNNILVMLISVISMTLFATSQPKTENVIEYVIPATMGIYILQSFAIGFLSKITLFHVYPALLIPIVFIICMIVVEIALKIPVVNRLFKL